MMTRIRTARLAAVAGAAALALSACGGAAGEIEDAVAPPAASDDGGGEGSAVGSTEQDGPESEASDGGGQVGAVGDGSGEDEASDEPVEDPSEGPEDAHLLTLISRDVSPDVPDVPLVNSGALAAMLKNTYEADGQEVSTSCNDDLRQEEGAYATCFTQLEGEDKMEWVGYPILFPGPNAEARSSGVLWVHDGTPTQQDLDVIGFDHSVADGSMGTGYGADAPIPAEQLGADALSTLKNDGYAPVYASITCEDDLDMEQFAAVACTAEKKGGGSVTVNVLPGPMQNGDRGLIVTVPADQAQAG